MNKWIIILILFFLTGLLFLFFYKHKKELQVIGFKYKSEKVTILVKNTTFMTISDNCNDVGTLCNFYETKSFYQYFDDIKFHIRIDSFNVSKLDTIIEIPVKYKKPIISFQDPKETIPNRVAFRLDDADPRMIKY